MKKYIAIALAGLVAACELPQQILSEQTDLKTCLTNEALARIQDGSALAAPVRTTAKKMVAACLPDTQSTEQTQSARTLAQEILTQLMKSE